jgi:hypothetical protein
MINNYVAFDNKIPNKNFMSNVKMKSMYKYGSYPNPVLTLPSLHHSMIKILDMGDKEDEGALKRAANHFILNWSKMFDLVT